MVGVEELGTHLVMATELPGSSRRSIGLVLASPWGGGSAEKGLRARRAACRISLLTFFSVASNTCLYEHVLQLAEP